MSLPVADPEHGILRDMFAYGRQLLAEGRDDEAMRLFEAYVRCAGNADPDGEHYTIRIKLAQHLGELGHTETALDHLRAALSLDSGRAEAFCLMGVNMVSQGEWRKGWPYFVAAMALVPPDRPYVVPELYDVVPQRYLALCLLQLARVGEAQPLVAKLAALATRAPAATAERGPSETAEARPARSAPHGTRPKVSVVTPTCEREPYLEHLYRCYRAQTHAPVEWIVLDDGPTPSVAMRTLSRQDPSVRYLHSPTRLSRAQKRNALAEAATGDVIVHFDDDTHYGPAYVEGMLEALRGFDVASLSAWYTYSPRHRFLGFCDLQVPADQHYVLRDGSNPTLVPHARVADRLTPWGQGFSFVYRKTLWERVRFREEADDDVRDFARRAFEGGGRGRAVPDADGTLMWVVGASEGQVAYPQYALPEHLSAHLFGAEMSFYRNAMARRPSGGNADPGVAREAGEAPEPGVRVVLKGAFASSEVAGL